MAACGDKLGVVEGAWIVLPLDPRPVDDELHDDKGETFHAVFGEPQGEALVGFDVEQFGSKGGLLVGIQYAVDPAVHEQLQFVFGGEFTGEFEFVEAR